MPVFKNVQKFKKWYKENYKGNFKNLNWDAVLDEVVEQLRTTGNADYELGRFETKAEILRHMIIILIIIMTRVLFDRRGYRLRRL